MIESFYIINAGGMLLYHHNWIENNKEVNPALLSGFISAIKQFANAIGKGTIKSMNISRKKWSYVNGATDLTAICVTDPMDDDDVLKQHFLEPLLKKFNQKYDAIIDQFSGQIDIFENFKSYVIPQYEIYKKQAAEKSYIVSKAQILSINGAIQLIGIDNLALLIRNTMNHCVVMTGDRLLMQKIGGLIQSLAPIRVTTDLNEYTDLFMASDMKELFANEEVMEYSTFNVISKIWGELKHESADLEKSILKDIIKRQVYLSEMDQIMLFRNNYISIVSKMNQYVRIVKKYETHKSLIKNLMEIVSNDKTEMEFLNEYIKKNLNMDVEFYIRNSRSNKNRR